MVTWRNWLGGEPPDFGRVVAILRDMIIFFAIASYFTGWIYLSTFLNQFGIFLSNIDFPFYYVFVYSYPVVLDLIIQPTFKEIGALLLFIGGVTLVLKLVKRAPVLAFFMGLGMFVYILVGFFLSAITTGTAHANHILVDGGGKHVVLIFKSERIEGYPGLTSDLTRAGDEDRLRLVWHDPDTLYVVVYFEEIDAWSDVKTYALRKEDLLTYYVNVNR